MESLYRFQVPPGRCSYLPQERASLEYEIVARLSPEEYLERMRQGWRRFGFSLFHPKCVACRQCRSLRVVVDRFRPDRSQRRALKANEDLTLTVGPPKVTRAKLELYDRYHAF